MKAGFFMFYSLSARNMYYSLRHQWTRSTLHQVARLQPIHEGDRSESCCCTIALVRGRRGARRDLRQPIPMPVYCALRTAVHCQFMLMQSMQCLVVRQGFACYCICRELAARTRWGGAARASKRGLLIQGLWGSGRCDLFALLPWWLVVRCSVAPLSEILVTSPPKPSRAIRYQRGPRITCCEMCVWW